jgi:hypothetical protein
MKAILNIVGIILLLFAAIGTLNALTPPGVLLEFLFYNNDKNVFLI